MDVSTRAGKAFRGFAGETADTRRDRNFSVGKRGLPRCVIAEARDGDGVGGFVRRARALRAKRKSPGDAEALL
jgi:hypothetical protein